LILAALTSHYRNTHNHTTQTHPNTNSTLHNTHATHQGRIEQSELLGAEEDVVRRLDANYTRMVLVGHLVLVRTKATSRPNALL